MVTKTLSHVVGSIKRTVTLVSRLWHETSLCSSTSHRSQIYKTNATFSECVNNEYAWRFLKLLVQLYCLVLLKVHVEKSSLLNHLRFPDLRLAPSQEWLYAPSLSAKGRIHPLYWILYPADWDPPNQVWVMRLGLTDRFLSGCLWSPCWNN